MTTTSTRSTSALIADLTRRTGEVAACYLKVVEATGDADRIFHASAMMRSIRNATDVLQSLGARAMHVHHTADGFDQASDAA